MTVNPMDFADIGSMPIPGGGLPEQEVIGGFYGGGQPGGGPDGGIPYAPGMAPDPYYEGEEFDILRGLTTEDRVRLQQQLVAVGLASGVVYGEIDGGPSSGTVGAMRSLLAMANRAGEEWTATLGRIATNPAMQEDAKEFDPTPHIKPDYATISQKIKQTFREALGRDPDKYEMQQLAGELTGFYELEQEAATEFETLQFEASQTPGSQPVEAVQQVDPMSRFTEMFESKYANELDFVQDKAEGQVAGASVDSAVGLASRAARGAR